MSQLVDLGPCDEGQPINNVDLCLQAVSTDTALIKITDVKALLTKVNPPPLSCHSSVHLSLHLSRFPHPSVTTRTCLTGVTANAASFNPIHTPSVFSRRHTRSHSCVEEELRLETCFQTVSDLCTTVSTVINFLLDK